MVSAKPKLHRTILSYFSPSFYPASPEQDEEERRTFRSRGLDLLLDLLHLVLNLLGSRLLHGRVVEEDARALRHADETEEEVDGGQEVVLGLDDEAPAGPDDAGGRQGGVLREGELLGGAGKVGDTGEDKSPLQKSKGVLRTN